MRRLLVSTTALSVAMSPLGTVPGFAQVLNEDGSVTGNDGAVLCVPTADAACDLEAIIAQMEADAAAAAAVEAEAAAAAAAEEAAAAEAAAQVEAEAKVQADAEAAATAEAAAAAEADAQAAAQAEADAAAAAATAAAEAEAAAQVEAEAAAARAAEEQAAAEAAAQAAAEAEAAARAAEDAAAAEAAAAEEAAPAEEPAVEEAPAEEPVVEEPVAEEPVAEEPVAEEPVAEEPVVEEPVAEEPVAEEPVAEEPVVEEPVAEEPVAEEPVAEEPVAEEPVAEEPVAEEPVAEEAVTEEPVAEEPAVEGTVETEAAVDPNTGEPVDPAVAAEAVAEAEAELEITEGGEVVDPAAGLVVAEPDPAVEVEPVEAPQVSETEVESLTQLLTADPLAINPSTLAAAELVAAAPAEDDAATEIVEADPANLVAETTETITEETARTSSEEFAAAPTALGDGRKSGFSDLEKAGLLVLGALAVGAIIKNNREAAATDTTVSTMGPGESRVVSNTGDRVIVLQPDGTYRVLKDDDTVIRRPGSTVRTETFRDGSTRTIVERADGTQVVTIRDATGRVLRRATYDDLGRELVLFDDLAEEEVVVIRDLPRPERRIVISSKDDDAALKRELAALEAEKAGRKFSLRQIREIPEVRALAATIDVEPVTFASGSAAIPAEEARDLADLGRVMQELLDENPREVFLIEGHTDATGKAAMNLALSDRRAESVALALTEYFDIPPENMVVQGYGETELLIDTAESEARNRRVEVRVITPLLRTASRG
ncbi:OmpA family protein [Tabrizicola sp.]|uniref:OmpA family protein n=1 Tax=Tabrizicola sp. TaxID=2005166 RepID=UPI0025D9BE65|nr:OmpA family protein [Tabrizicola sp.]